jgi:purine-binding chemotaxis protein CheW
MTQPRERELKPGTRRRAPVAEIRHSPMNRELHIVGFQIGRETYGLLIASLHEIVRVPEITAVPDAPDYMEGVINLRGKIVSVIDLRKRLGIKDVVAGKRNRILVVEHEGRLCGLMVDSASEVLKIPANDVEPSSTVFQEGGLNCVTGLGKYRGRLIVLLDVAKLLEYSGMRRTSDSPEGAPRPTTNLEARRAAGGK